MTARLAVASTTAGMARWVSRSKTDDGTPMVYEPADGRIFS